MADEKVLGSPFGGIQISDGDDAANEWLAEARRRMLHDAEFHYRVKAVRQCMVAAYQNAPGEAHIAVALLIDEKVRRENGLR
jgi:hypothetical protein